MSEETHSRERDIKRAIVRARDQIEQAMDGADPHQMVTLRLMLDVVGILNSEYGTIYRIMERQDEAAKDRKAIHDKLFGAQP